MTWFFDLDGTLADTDRDIRDAWKAALADLNLNCPEFEAKFVAGPPIDEMVRILFPERFTPALADAVRRGFAAHYDADGFPATREYPGALDVVRELKKRGDRVYILTNKRYVGACKMARHFGWDRLFDDVYAGDMYKDGPIGKLKKGALLALVMREKGLDPVNCRLVGDTTSDFDAARQNGVRSIGVTWGYGPPAELAQADTSISTPAELTSDQLFG